MTSGAIETLPPVEVPGHEASTSAGPEHPMRIATRRAAGLDDRGWTDDLRDDVTRNFDSLAAGWQATRTSPQRTAVVVDALDRGFAAVPPPAGPAIEVGSGVGTYSGLLAERFSVVAAVDLSLGMLLEAPAAPAQRLRVDAAALPCRDRSAAAVVLINAFLFPSEVDRVLADDGVVVWVNSSGEQTPIHLTSSEVADALPGTWDGVASGAGVATWCVLHRTGRLAATPGRTIGS